MVSRFLGGKGGGRRGAQEASRRALDGPAKATTNGQDACRSKTQISYKNKGFGRSGWFSKPLNYFIKIDLSRVHDLEKCLFSRISAFLDRPCSAERRVLKLQNARNKAFLVILCRIGCRFVRSFWLRMRRAGGPKVLFLKHFGALMSCGLKSFWRALLGLSRGSLVVTMIL